MCLLNIRSNIDAKEKKSLQSTKWYVYLEKLNCSQGVIPLVKLAMLTAFGYAVVPVVRM